MIPLVDLNAQYEQLKPAMLAKIEEVLESRAFIQGMYVSEFETQFAKMHGAAFGSGCDNGTAALFLALAAAGVKPGDEVITTTHTFFATAEAIVHAGAKPVLVDILPDTYCMDPKAVEAAITPKTRAIVPVHIYGTPVDMAPLQALAAKHKLLLVEDAAQAHLATYKGKKVGTLGDTASFSFFPGKNLGAYGDAGAVFTSTAEQDHVVRQLLDHGRRSKYVHEVIGYNLRMDGLQAAILSVKLAHLEKWTELRREHARTYRKCLDGSGLTVMAETKGGEGVYHLFVVEVANRVEVMDFLRNRGVTTSIHYPVPLHLQPALAHLGHKRGDFPHAERAAERIVSLPIYAELRSEQIEFIVSELKRIAKP